MRKLALVGLFALMAGGCVTAPKGAWEGRRIAVMGDSISDPDIDWWTHWWKRVGEDLGAEMRVYARNGMAWDDVPRQTDALTDDRGGDVDAILVFLGTNDFNANVPLGDWWRETNVSVPCNATTAVVKHRVPVFDKATFRGRINIALDKLKRIYPDRQIVLMTPIRRGYFRCSVRNVRQDDSYANEIGLYLEDYARTVREAGDIWAVPVIDTYSESGLIPAMPSFLDCCNRESTDHLHPSTEGCRRLALTVAARLRTLPPTFRTETKCARPDAFKIMAFDVRHGETDEGKIDLPAVAQAIHRARPRYAVLRGVDVGRRRSGGVDQTAEFERLMGMATTYAKAKDCDGDGEEGVLILSEPAPVSVRRLALSEKGAGVLLCEFPDCFIGATYPAPVGSECETSARIREVVGDGGKPVFLVGDRVTADASAKDRVCD